MKHFPRRRFLQLAVGAAALPAVSGIARAQSYPSRPITIIVGYAAGGPTDTVARILAERMKCWVIAFLDRVNVGFAALTMNKELGLTAEMYGFGAGVFFFRYFIFEVPSNLILERVGARRWIARIMISWGVIAASFAFVPSISAIFQGFGFSFCKRGKSRGDGKIIRFSRHRESDSLWECRLPQTLTAFRPLI
jgi:hypothetical protein